MHLFFCVKRNIFKQNTSDNFSVSRLFAKGQGQIKSIIKTHCATTLVPVLQGRHQKTSKASREIKKMNGKWHGDYKVAMVTGGCDEIGKACVDMFALHKIKVVVLDSKDKIEKQMKSMEVPGDIFFVPCDLKEEKEIETAVQRALSKCGRIDYLINNTSIFEPQCHIDAAKVEDFHTFLQQTVVCYMTTAKYILPYLRQTKGSVVNIALIFANLGLKGCAMLSAAAGAILSFTKALALDEGVHGVRVNCLTLASHDTALLREYAGELPMRFFEDISVLRRLGRPDEIGKACVFLATDATFCTGTELNCCGGASIGLGLKHVKDYPYV